MFNLIIVESPAKCSKIEHFLSDQYPKENFKVVATKGHIMEIKKPGLNIDIDNGFKPVYVYKNNKQIDIIKNLSKEAKEIYIATDLDYSGSFIGYSVCLLLNLDIKTTKRLIFNSITKTAIIEAFENPTTLILNHVYYEKARQIIDRLIGFKLTACAYKYLQNKNNSVGRCQTIALKLVDEKEKEINDFIDSNFNKIQDFYYKVDGKIYHEREDNVYFTEHEFYSQGEFIGTEEDVEEIEEISYYPHDPFYKMVVQFVDNLKAENDKLTFETVQQFLNNKDKLKFTLTNTKKIRKSIEPPKPFITSTIQQTAARLFGYSIETIMKILQSLYEKGFITYIRTDCPIMSEEFKKTIKEFIKQYFGEEYINLNNNDKIKEHSQNGHEAIRVTENVPTFNDLTNQEENIYNLIEVNTVQSQMSNYEYELTTLTISNNINDVKLTAYQHLTIFEGFKKFGEGDKAQQNMVYQIDKNQELKFKDIDFIYSVKPVPKRYNEQKIIKQLDKLGIGRPSTFATFTKKIKERDYVETNNINGLKILCTNYKITNDQTSREITKTEKLETFFNESNKFQPTTKGVNIMKFTDNCFNQFINYDYTAKMEKQLDKIANGEIDYLTVLKDFWNSFNNQLKEFNESIKKNKKKVKEFKHNDQKYLLKSGVYGYYVTVGGKNKSLKGINKEFDEITINDIIEFLENKTTKPQTQGDKQLNCLSASRAQGIILGEYKDKTVSLFNGRFGYYFVYDNKNYSLKNFKTDKSTIENNKEKILKLCIREIQSFIKTLDYQNYEFIVKANFKQKNYYVNVFKTIKDKRQFIKSLRITTKDMKVLNYDINSITSDIIINKLNEDE